MCKHGVPGTLSTKPENGGLEAVNCAASRSVAGYVDQLCVHD